MRPFSWGEKLVLWAAFVCIALVVLLAGCATPERYARPPAQYQGDRISRVEFTDDAVAKCAQINAAKGSIACATVGGMRMIVPNPCRWPDPFAQLMCHELGHNNGYPADHPKH